MVQLAVHVDRVGLGQVDQLFDCFIDENDTNQRGERLFREAGDVADKRAGISCHKDDTQEGGPQSNAGSQGEVGQRIVSETRPESVRKPAREAWLIQLSVSRVAAQLGLSPGLAALPPS